MFLEELNSQSICCICAQKIKVQIIKFFTYGAHEMVISDSVLTLTIAITYVS